MTWHTPPSMQGQAVEVAYAWDEGDLLRRTTDRSDRSTVTRRLADAWDYADTERRAEQLRAWDPWNDEAPAWLDRELDEAPVE